MEIPVATREKDNATKGNQSSDSSDLDYSIKKLESNLHRNWTAGLSVSQKQVLGVFIGNFATFLEFIDKDAPSESVSETRGEYLKSPIARYLKALNRWLETSVPLLKNDSQVGGDLPDPSQVEKFLSKTLSEADRLEAFSQTKEKSKQARVSEGNEPTRPTKELEKISKQVSTVSSDVKEVVLSMGSIKADLLSLTKTVRESSSNAQNEAAALQRPLEQRLQELLYKIIEVENTHNKALDLFREQVSLSHNIATQISNIERHSQNKIHIRDSVQILEIRQEVEKFVTQDILQALSKSLMPTIAMLKEVNPEDLSSALDSLEQKCKALGLLSLEDLYR
jgi:hypothetical protein